MTESDDPTIVRHVRRALQRERYPDDRRAPPPVNWLAWLPLALACLTGVAGYVKTQAKVDENTRDLERVERTYQDWNRTISERVRDLEKR